MAWNPSPKVAIAREYAKRFNKKQVVILAIGNDDTLEYATYGETKNLCSEAKHLGDIAFNAVMKHYQNL